MQFFNNKKNLIIFLIGTAILTSFLCYILTTSSHGPPDGKKLRIGYLPIAASLPLFVAIEHGYFENEGFEVELIQFGSSNEMALAGIRGDLDVMVTCATNAVLDAMDVSGKSVEAFLSNGYIKTGRKDALQGRWTAQHKTAISRWLNGYINIAKRGAQSKQ